MRPELVKAFASGNGHANGNGHAKNGASAMDGPQIRSQQFAQFQSDAPACDNCGAITVRNGNCYLCHNCGQSMGCS
jgi:ribonucleoside-diphosphate reductase alpha chain